MKREFTQLDKWQLAALAGLLICTLLAVQICHLTIKLSKTEREYRETIAGVRAATADLNQIREELASRGFK